MRGLGAARTRPEAATAPGHLAPLAGALPASRGTRRRLAHRGGALRLPEVALMG